MVKNGPCYHCGVTSTPLWRNGPPEKPVLCNACGSRWRTKGTLTNYTPLNMRPESDIFEEQRVPRVKTISINKNKQVKFLKRKKNLDSVPVKKIFFDYNYGYQKIVEEDTSNRSSSGSAISYSESCTQFGGTDASDLTGPANSIVWDSMAPPHKRTCVGRPKVSSVEKLREDLCTILHEQQSSYFSGSSEEDLLFESEGPMVSVEIGHGGVLMRHPSSIAREAESEASSLSVDNKFVLANEAYSSSLTVPVYSESKNANFQQEKTKREKTLHENFQILSNCKSSLCNIDLRDVLNFEELTRHLTNEEQQDLVKYLPVVDTVNFPDSLKSMFDSDQFKESLSCFKQLLSKGVFDMSVVGVKTEDCKTLKELALSNLPKFQWVEHYNLLKKCKISTAAIGVSGGPNVMKSNKIVNMMRSRDGLNQNVSELETAMKRSPKSVNRKASYEDKESIYTDSSSCLSPRSLFTLPLDDNSSVMTDSFHFTDDGTFSDQDLLLDVPFNNSFPQAELIHPASGYLDCRAYNAI